MPTKKTAAAKVADLPVTPKKGTKLFYSQSYKTMQIRKEWAKSVADAAAKITKGKERYESVVSGTLIPWWYIACTHWLEASGDWKAILHNGQRIVGTGKKSTIVPIGVGPFATWEAAAKDAIKREGLDQVKDWSVGNVLLLSERWNGTGYLLYHPEENSPYLWARTTMNDGFGKYVKDGKFDPKAPTSGQIGFAALMKALGVAA